MPLPTSFGHVAFEQVAVIVDEPLFIAVASPWLPAALLIVPTDAVPEDHVTVEVIFCVLPSV